MRDSPFKQPAVFTPAFRLLRKTGFSGAMNAEKMAGKHFKVFFSENNEKNARLGIIASKRIFSHATDRNRFKRMVREAFRQHHVKTRNIDLVVMAKYADVQNLANHELIALFNRIESRCARL